MAERERRECRYCHQPIEKLSPDTPDHLAWGHLTREDAYDCLYTFRKSGWPLPVE